MLKSLLALPPLSMSAAEYKQLAITTHSFHGTGPDMARFLGFPEHEARQLGHWLRDRNAASAEPQAAPGVHGTGRATGALNVRGTMIIRYTQGANRLGERAEQLAVRTKLVRFVRSVLQRKGFLPDWSSLPPGIDDWSVLDSSPAEIKA